MTTMGVVKVESEQPLRGEYIFARTVAEAFPTHSDHEIYTIVEPMTDIERIYCWAVGILFLIALVTLT
jgi:hypothetical protein